MSRNALALGLAAIVAGVASIVVSGAAAPSRADALSLRQKVSTITRFAAAPARAPRRTLVTQNEVNAYLLFDAAEQIPAGVVQPEIDILGGGRVTARAVVDLDAVRRQKTQRSLLDPMN